MANPTNTKCLIGEARMNWPRVFEPESFKGGDPKFQVTLTFPKSNTELYQKIQNAINECLQKAVNSKFGGKMPKNLDLPRIKDGDEDFEGEGYPDQWVIKASSKYKPEVVKRMIVAGKPQFVQITDESEFYAGCYGFASVTFCAFNVDMNKGVSCQLDSLLKTRDGERFTSKSDAATDFGGLADDVFGDNPDDDNVW